VSGFKTPTVVSRWLTDWRIALGVVATASAVAARHYLAPGIPFQGDIWPHVALTESTFQILRSGDIPLWHFFFYSGFPGGVIYGPLYYAWVAIVELATACDVWQATKLFLFLAHIASGCAMFMFARRVTGDARVALVAAVTYAFAPWHAYLVLGMGRLTVSVLFLVLPLALWAVELALTSRVVLDAAVAGLCLALLPLTHAGFALYAAGFVACWAAFRVGTSDDRNGARGQFVVAVLVAVCGSLWFLIPALQARLAFPAAMPQHAVPTQVSVLSLLGLSTQNWYQGAAIGASSVYLAFQGLTAYHKSHRLFREPAGWCLILGLVLVFGTALPYYDRLLAGMAFEPHRFLVFLMVFVALLAGVGAGRISKGFTNDIVLVLLLAPLLVELTVTMPGLPLQSAEGLLRNRAAAYDTLRASGARRILDAGTADAKADPYAMTSRWPGAGYVFSGLTTPLGSFQQLAPRHSEFASSVADSLSRDLGSAGNEYLSAFTMKGLLLLDVNGVVVEPQLGRQRGQVYARLTRDLEWQVEDGIGSDPPVAWTMVPTSPVIASQRVAPWQYARNSKRVRWTPRQWSDFVGSLQFDRNRAVLDVIYVGGNMTETMPAPVFPPDVRSHDVSGQRVTMEVAVASECFARLAYTYDQNLEVWVNGRKAPVWEGADHFIVTRLDKGMNRIQLRPVLGTLRIVLILIGVVGILVVTWLAHAMLRPRGQPDEPNARLPGKVIVQR
jgi:hypothetical protein